MSILINEIHPDFTKMKKKIEELRETLNLQEERLFYNWETHGVTWHSLFASTITDSLLKGFTIQQIILLISNTRICRPGKGQDAPNEVIDNDVERQKYVDGLCRIFDEHKELIDLIGAEFGKK